ncbi:NAD(+) diphosphatase [Baekduia sp. Peel2402]|uniref:NAD(+) diphosphatase n=1 Tax=Baekduia sp. Peel2402 TaxID=3458296 RepID=UPI00403E8B8B
MSAARADPAARAIVVGRAGALAEPVALEDGEHDDAIFLGVQEGGAPLFAVEREGVELKGLRDLAVSLPAAQLGAVAYASGVANWARATRFCGICGTATRAGEGGHVRICENGHHHHPRTDPVVIMLVGDGDRVLMGRQASWPAGRYSALAGFVEPGEPLEAAVAREIAEESGIRVRDVRYVASQPWPFPVSLMLGFHATYESGEPHALDGELEDVRWFTRDEVTTAASGDDTWIDGPDVDGLLLPPATAIARLLIDRWLAEG